METQMEGHIRRSEHEKVVDSREQEETSVAEHRTHGQAMLYDSHGTWVLSQSPNGRISASQPQIDEARKTTETKIPTLPSVVSRGQTSRQFSAEKADQRTRMSTDFDTIHPLLRSWSSPSQAGNGSSSLVSPKLHTDTPSSYAHTATSNESAIVHHERRVNVKGLENLDAISAGVNVPKHKVLEIVAREMHVSFPIKFTIVVKATNVPPGSHHPSVIQASSEVEHFTALRHIVNSSFGETLYHMTHPDCALVIDGARILYPTKYGQRQQATHVLISDAITYDECMRKLYLDVTNYGKDCACDDCRASKSCITYCICTECQSSNNIPEIIVHLSSYKLMGGQSNFGEQVAAQKGMARPSLVLTYDQLEEAARSRRRLGEKHRDLQQPLIIVPLYVLQDLVTGVGVRRNLVMELAQAKRDIDYLRNRPTPGHDNRNVGGGTNTGGASSAESLRETVYDTVVVQPASAEDSVSEHISSSSPIDDSDESSGYHPGSEDDDGSESGDDPESKHKNQDNDDNSDDEDDVWTGRRHRDSQDNKSPPRKVQRVVLRAPALRSRNPWPQTVAASPAAGGTTSEPSEPNKAVIRAAQLGLRSSTRR